MRFGQAAIGGVVTVIMTLATPLGAQVLAPGGEFRGELKRGESKRYELAEGATGEVWLESRPSTFHLFWIDREGKRRRGDVREFVIREGAGGGAIEVRHDGYPEGPQPFRLRLVPGGAERWDVEERFEQALTARRQPGADARQVFRAMISDLERLGDQTRLALALLQMGMEGVRRSDPQAREWLDRARRIYVTTADRIQEGVAHSWLGQLALAEHRYTDARASFELAATVGRESGDRMREAIARNNVAQTWWSEGELPKAEEEFRAVLAMRRELRDPVGEAYTSMGLGQVHWSQGNPQGALEAFERAEGIWKEQKNRAGEADCLNARGLVRFLLGEYEAAAGLYERSLAIWRAIEDPAGEGRTLNNRGMLRAARRDYARAVEDYGQSLAKIRTRPDPRSESYVLHNLANATADQGRPREALALYDQSLARKQELGDRWGEAATLEARGEAYRQLHERERAGRDFDQAIELRVAMGDGFGEGQARAARARLRREMGALEPALAEARLALERVETVRSSLANRDTRATFFARRRDVADLLVGILTDLKRDREALEASERSRARSLLEAFGEEEIELRELAEEDRRRLAALRARVRAASDSVSRYESAPMPAPVKERARTALAQALEELREVESRVRKGQKAYRIWSPDLVDAKEIQKALGPNDVLLEYWLSDRESLLWEISRAGIAVHRLPARAVIEREAARLAANVERCRRSRDCETLIPAGLARVLLPVAVDGKSVRLAADGVLHSMPFAALAPRAAAISFVPSGWMLASGAGESGRRAKGGALIVADPVFRADDIRVGKAATNPDGLPRLRFSREEAKAVEVAFPGAKVLLDAGARKDAVVAAVASARWLHFATHALVDERRPLLSSLALAAVDVNGQPVDGFVRAHEVLGWRLSADLVVLSACRSAQGQPLAGEGLLGLSRAFLEAGARRVVGTLWEIDDQATVELMRLFYAGLTRNQPPAVALREAQQKLQANPAWSSPYYWAGFVLVSAAR